MLISEYKVTQIPGGCDDDGNSVSIRATVPADISNVFPYVNAQVPGCAYNRAGQVLNWREGGHVVVLRAQELSISNLPDWQSAKQAIGRLAAFLNQTWDMRDRISPLLQARPQANPLTVYKLLPNTNCRACGLPTCYTFALKLIAREQVPEDCPVLIEPDWAEQRDALQAMLPPPPAVLFTHS